MSIYKYVLSHDYHIHTALSVCARKQMTIENIIKRAERIGYVSMGISDHLGGYTTPDDIRRNKAKIKKFKTRVKVYTGCEMSLYPDGTPCFSDEETSFIDYKMVGIEHVIGKTPLRDEEPVKYLDAFVKRFEKIIEINDRIDVIVHPIDSLMKYCNGRPLISQVSKKTLEYLLRGLARRNIAIELKDSCENGETAYFEVREFYSMAKDIGLKVTAPSDSHGLDRLGFQVNWVRIADELKFTEKMFWSPEES